MQLARTLSGRCAAAPARPGTSTPRTARPRLAPPPAATNNPFAALFQPKPKKQGGAASSPSTAALVDEILDLANSTKAGVKTPAAKADRIAELAAQLKSVRGRAPTTRSPDFWGKYAVAYCSNPAAPGGPVLTSGLGRAVAADQEPVQILEPGRLTNRVTFKALGFLPNTAQQSAGLEITGPHSYRVTFDAREKNNVRDFEVLFLNGDVRVAEYQPADGRPAQLFVFERLGDVEGDGEGEEEEGGGAPPPPRQARGAPARPAAPAPAPAPARPAAEKAPAFNLASFFAKPRAVESLATIVEREAAAADRRAGSAPPPPPPPPPAAKRGGSRPPRPAPAPSQKAAPPPSAAPPQMMPQMLTILRRPGTSPKQAGAGAPPPPPRPDPAAAARESVARFADAAKTAAADVREATAAARAASTEAAPVLRQTAGPRAAVARAAAVAEAAEAEFKEAAATLAEAEAEVKRATEALKFLEKQRV